MPVLVQGDRIVGKSPSGKILYRVRRWGQVFVCDMGKTADHKLMSITKNTSGQTIWCSHIANMMVSNGDADLTITTMGRLSIPVFPTRETFVNVFLTVVESHVMESFRKVTIKPWEGSQYNSPDEMDCYNLGILCEGDGINTIRHLILQRLEEDLSRNYFPCNSKRHRPWNSAHWETDITKYKAMADIAQSFQTGVCGVCQRVESKYFADIPKV